MKLSITNKSDVFFHNNVDFCVGTGRMGLALQKEYIEQLKLCQREIGFKHIRGHGLFSDDMAIYQEYKEGDKTKAEYNFTYLDLVMDSYLENGLEPFLELGFMPEKLSSDPQTLFYWKAHTVPPKSYDAWCDLVQATLSHLIARYGRDRVVTWPIEVWNEPNLSGFWKGADMSEYFKLFSTTFKAVKEVDADFKVGGPAVCGGSDVPWITAFMNYCAENKIPLDFVTRHHYTTEFPERAGHYGYAKLSKAEGGFKNLHSTREIIDSHEEYKGLQIHVTENNTSYIPNCPLHDTNLNAAYMAHQLSRLGDDLESYSYWTFGDIFEEQGVPFTPFHGGFGLVANGGIPKPTFWTFAFYKKLKDVALPAKGTREGATNGNASDTKGACGSGNNANVACVFKNNNAVAVQTADGYAGVIWNYSLGEKKNSPKQTDSSGVGEDSTQCTGTLGEAVLPVSIKLSGEGEYTFITKTVDEETCNPLKVWHDLGEPSSLSKEQLELLKMSANPLVQTEIVKASRGKISKEFVVRDNGIVYFEVRKRVQTSDRGYDYERALRNPKTGE